MLAQLQRLTSCLRNAASAKGQPALTRSSSRSASLSFPRPPSTSLPLHAHTYQCFDPQFLHDPIDTGETEE
jgi:hypothetical protein